MARISAEADMLTKNSAHRQHFNSHSPYSSLFDFAIQLTPPGNKPTLHSALRSSSRNRTHTTNHEVRKQLVLALILPRDVLPKVGNLTSLVGTLEGAAVRGPGSRGVAVGGTDGGGAEGAGREVGLCRGAEARAGGSGEGRHRERREGRVVVAER